MADSDLQHQVADAIIGVAAAAAASILSLLLWVGRLMYAGKLVSRSVLDDVRADRDARLAEQRAHISAQQAVIDSQIELARVHAAQAGDLLESARALRALTRGAPPIDGRPQ